MKDFLKSCGVWIVMGLVLISHPFLMESMAGGQPSHGDMERTKDRPWERLRSMMTINDALLLDKEDRTVLISFSPSKRDEARQMWIWVPLHAEIVDAKGERLDYDTLTPGSTWKILLRFREESMPMMIRMISVSSVEPE